MALQRTTRRGEQTGTRFRATATNRPAATVEEREFEAQLSGRANEILLSAEERDA